MYLSEGLSTV